MKLLFHRLSHPKAESGQAIVLVALLMIIMIAALGLAVDGGNLFRLFRDVQDAADSAALAAAVAHCTDGDIRVAASQSAKSNGYEDGLDGTFVQVHEPPSGGTYFNQDNYVEVIIEAENDPFFIDVVYSGPLSVRVRAVAYCDKGTKDHPANALDEVALFARSEVCNPAVDVVGHAQTLYGGIHSNSSIGWSSSDSTVYGTVTTRTTFDETGTNNAFFQYQEPPPPVPSQVVKDPQENVEPAVPMPTDLFTAAEFLPGGPAWQAADAASDVTAHYDAASCSSINDAPPASWLATWVEADGGLQDGIYVSDCSFNLDLSMNASADISRVTIVAAGTINVSGSNHNLVAYHENLLLFSGRDYTTPSDICSLPVVNMGGTNQQWTGLVYAPFGLAQMSGSDGASLHGAIVANSIDLVSSDLEIVYDGFFSNAIPFVPPNVSLSE